ncbi:hypothetical protein GW17_00054883 [Ensete ventricosum]|nr:hypothetical protein GW17_00054883 [Ensete ventricosum]
MNLSPSNLDANLTSTPFLDPDPAPPTLDDPSPGGNSKESRIGGTGNRGGGGESSGRGDREEGTSDKRKQKRRMKLRTKVANEAATTDEGDSDRRRVSLWVCLTESGPNPTSLGHSPKVSSA